MENNEVKEVNVIETALAKENITAQLIAKLKEEYSGLVINGIDDKEGFNKVEDARKDVKKYRVAASKICKLGREKANQESKDWIKKEHEVVDAFEEIESVLEAESNRIKEIEKQILFEAAQKAKLPLRTEKLLSIGITVEDAELLKIDDNQFMQLFNEFYEKHLTEKAEALRIENERQQQIAANKLAEEQRIEAIRLEAERVEQKRLADIEAENQRLENERLKKEADAKEAELKKEREATAKREAELKAKADAEIAEVNRLAKIESDKQAEILAKQKAESAARLKAEQTEKIKLEAELKERRFAELKAKQELEAIEKQRLADEKKAAKAPDKDKMKIWINDLQLLSIELKSEDSNLIAIDIKNRFESFKKWALTQIETI